MNKCKHCGTVPDITDVGGNNPYYEICCKCGHSAYVGTKNKDDAINTWDILNERKVEDGRC